MRTYILFSSCENSQFEVFRHRVQEFFGERPDVEHHFKSQILEFVFGRLSAIFIEKFLREILEILLLLSPSLQSLLVLDV